MPKGLTALPRTWASTLIQSDDLAPGVLGQFMRTIEPSFDTGEQLTSKLYFPQAALILGYRIQVLKTLAGTDAGTIEFRNAAGTRMTANGLVTLAASQAQGFEVNGSGAFTANNLIAAGDWMEVQLVKPTAGGKVRIVIEYRPK